MSILIQHRLKIVLAFAVVFMAVAGVFASGNPVASQEEPSAWSVRCNDNKDYCEVYWRAVNAETGQRVAEFAIGYPEDSKAARGVLILPLGVLLTEELQMQVDAGQPFKFKVRYCDAGGCVAFLNLNDQLLGVLRAGSTATVKMKSFQGQDVNIGIPLTGLKRTLEQIS